MDAELDQACDIDLLIEDHIYRLAGSFIFVLDACDARRIYLDANGSKSLVYEPQFGLAGATTPLLLTASEYDERFDFDLYRGLVVDQHGWFPAGMTAHRGVRRLMCNHYLDLDTMAPIRHWPRGEIEEVADVDAAIATIIDETRSVIQPLHATGRASMALTSGNETRLMLACCRAFHRDIDFVTVDALGAKLDVKRATELAKRFKLSHRLLPYREADEQGTRAWQMRVGHCVTGSNMTMHPSVEPLNGRIFLGGLGGEIGRGFLWLDSQEDTAIDEAGIVSRLKLPQHARLLEEVRQWLKPLQHYRSLFLLDLAYMELRMSCWAFSQSYAMPSQVEVNPLICRKIYTAMLSLPPSLRRDNGMIFRAIQQTWPEVLALPINKYGDWRDRARIAGDAIADPRRAIRKIRQVGAVRLGALFSSRRSR
ncbi:hypothetical protein FKV68_20475 [Sinorhizobium mexicanum]|uniref:Asparagine synthetase domain-containing protein n=1 Tax=Sinorhizobium mexicanum TaxID=375549 RepID=A0A859QE19_9HYPH|nr:hypothetical protein FKV68_20475 [Sinorhizobium mexicanum]